jgi:hypothetical protein
MLNVASSDTSKSLAVFIHQQQQQIENDRQQQQPNLYRSIELVGFKYGKIRD